VLQRAFRTDVRPLVAEARRRNGAAIDPIATYRALGYRAEKIRERGRDAVATGI
jgi:L-rhamnose isomerase/sugar isomerase